MGNYIILLLRQLARSLKTKELSKRLFRSNHRRMSTEIAKENKNTDYLYG